MNPNQGSFGSVAGGVSPELQAAMASRQGGTQAPVSSQVTNTAPTADPTAQAPAAPTAAAPMPAEQVGQEMPFGSAEAKMIIGHLGNRLKAGSKFHGV